MSDSTRSCRPRERMKIPRQPMPEQEADARRHNFGEVNQGLTRAGGDDRSASVPGVRERRTAWKAAR